MRHGLSLHWALRLNAASRWKAPAAAADEASAAEALVKGTEGFSAAV